MEPCGEISEGEILSEPVSGGCINQAFRLSRGDRRYFVKLNRADRLAMFEEEADGLEALSAAGAIRTPANLGCGIAGHNAYLLLEYIDLGGQGDPVQAGRQLAALHRHSGKHFGWHRDNTLGSTPQPNTPNSAWPRFWQQCRLGHQLDLAASRGESGKLQERGRRLLESVPLLLEHTPPPSLLHGDLWSGNFAYDREGAPVIFDPAVYHGDRETDLAMSELFGGFPTAFYAAYKEAWPLPPGYPVRKQLYNLYHILNHLNLFGGGYRQQALSLIEQLLAESG
ncbi:MAG: fructosamine kinase family protein [Sedimenticola sp.]|nr:fructosamine kinase family protein [Sedimenticola sp.]